LPVCSLVTTLAESEEHISFELPGSLAEAQLNTFRGSFYLWTVFLILGSILELVATRWQVWLVAKALFGFGQGGFQG
jgi:hypothetical protein